MKRKTTTCLGFFFFNLQALLTFSSASTAVNSAAQLGTKTRKSEQIDDLPSLGSELVFVAAPLDPVANWRADSTYEEKFLEKISGKK